MNGDRRAEVEGLAGIVRALQGDEASRSLIRALGKTVESLVKRESKSVRAMEPYKDSPTTYKNFMSASVSLEHLEKAAKEVAQADFEEVVFQLEDALNPDVSEAPAPRVKRKKVRNSE